MIHRSGRIERRRSPNARNSSNHPAFAGYYRAENSRGAGLMARLSVHADTQKRLQALFEEGTCSGLTDGTLMDRLASPGDRSAAEAFLALVERHGPMVLR